MQQLPESLTGQLLWSIVWALWKLFLDAEKMEV